MIAFVAARERDTVAIVGCTLDSPHVFPIRIGRRPSGSTRWTSPRSSSPDPVLARHAGNLALISGPSGPRPDLDVAEGHPVAAALAAVVAYDGVARIEPAAELRIILPSSVG